MCFFVKIKKSSPVKTEKDETTRDTTFFRKQLALLTSVSVRQHSGACNVRYYVTAYYRNLHLPIGSSSQIRCEAQGCIRNKLPMHLSSTGYFLSASLIITCSRQSL